jgi:hypothetical protein
MTAFLHLIPIHVRLVIPLLFQRLLPGRGILDNWWQTETGWPVCANPIGLEGGALPVKPGSSTVPMPGYDVQILDDTGKRVGAGVTGEICIKLPLPPSCLYTVWQNHARFESSYLSAFPGFYQTGDGGYIDADGYLFIMGRTDDVINVAAHRLSTGEMEEIIATHSRVAECAVFGVADALKGEVPVGLIVLKDSADQSPAAAAASHAQIYAELVALVRARIGAIASFRHVFVVKRLPKTRSGKILRATIRKLTTTAAVPPPSTIDDPAILDEIREVLKGARGGRVLIWRGFDSYVDWESTVTMSQCKFRAAVYLLTMSCAICSFTRVSVYQPTRLDRCMHQLYNLVAAIFHTASSINISVAAVCLSMPSL